MRPENYVDMMSNTQRYLLSCMYVATRLVKLRAGVTNYPLTHNFPCIHPHRISAPDSAEKGPNSACMLTRHLSRSHTIRTAHLVLPHLLRFYTSSLSQPNNDDNLKAPPELTLDWKSGNEDFDYRCDDYEGNVSTLRDIRGQKIKVEINPILDWSPRQCRISDNDINYQLSCFTDESPTLRWLPASKTVLEPQLDWPSGLPSGLGALLEKARGLSVRRLKSQPGDPRSPEDGLVRRYTLEKELEAEEPERRRLVVRIWSKNWGLCKEWLNPEAEAAEVQQVKLSEEERTKREIFESEREVLEIAGTLRKEQEELESCEVLANEQEELGHEGRVLEAIQTEQEAQADGQEKSIVRRIQSRHDIFEIEQKGPTIRRVRSLWDQIGAGRNIQEVQEAILEALEIQPEAPADEQEEPTVRWVETARPTLKTEQEQPIVRQVQSGPEVHIVGKGREKILADEQEEPIATQVQGVRATPKNKQQVQNARKSKQDSSRRAQKESGLIRHTLARHKPSTTVAKAELVGFTHTEIREGGVSFEPQRTMEDQPTVSTSTGQVEGSIRRAVSNDASMGVATNIGEAVPNDINLMVKKNDGRAILHESDTVATEKKTHNLKRTNINPESSLGSYQKAKLESRKKRKPLKQAKDGSPETVLNYDIEHLLSSLNILQEEDKSSPELPEVGSEIGLTVSELSSTGDGLAVHKNRVYVVPFGIPGDKVNATIRDHNTNHSVAKITSVVMPSSNRDDSLVRCKYFGTCAGCQLQMLPYAVQLEHKRKVVQKAFKNFSNLPPELLPEVGETMASPLQYGYRTKLTPHFNGPRRGGFKPGMPVPNIGFMTKDLKFNMDIEDCPIGTDAVRKGMKEQREFVTENFITAFKRGATLLLRESTIRTYLEDSAKTELEEQLEGHGKKYTEEKVCITESSARSIEYVGDLKFEGPAGSFFQNNSSILPEFTSYIRENLNLPVVKKTEGPDETTETTERPKYLVDAYCGSGLFSITCGQGLEKVWGIDIDKASIAAARRNALENNIQNASFIGSTAEDIFGKLQFPGSETSLIIDPPKKGCDKLFLDQLLDFAPKRIVYVSCNVHTQARDIGYVLMDERGKGYKIDSIKGCDFFPQTQHVESIAVMTKVD